MNIPKQKRFYGRYKSLFLSLALALFLSACSSTVGNTGTGATATTNNQTPVGNTGNGATATTSNQTPVAATTQPTSNQGTTSSKVNGPLTAIRMVSNTDGWALSGTQILRTSDGGKQWLDVSPPGPGLSPLTVAQFYNLQYAWIATPAANNQSFVLLRTTNGAKSWQRINVPITQGEVATLDVPHFVNANEGWIEAIGSPGAGSARASILHTTDGGQNWKVLAVTTAQYGMTQLGYPSGISFKDALNGWVTGEPSAGYDDRTNPLLYVTHTGGQNWKQFALPALTGITNLTEVRTTPPVLFGNDGILPVHVTYGQQQQGLVLYITHDGGENWSATSLAPVNDNNTVYVVDPQNVWATDMQSGRFYHTSNAGQNWQYEDNTHGQIKALSFTDNMNGWAITKTSLLHMSNGGSWNIIWS